MRKLLLDEVRGIYIPQVFARDFTGWTGISDEDRAILLAGPEHDEYDDAWAEVLQDATWTDSDGVEWTLEQNGDLFAVAYPQPDNVIPLSVCSDCLQFIANGDITHEDAPAEKEDLEAWITPMVKACVGDTGGDLVAGIPPTADDEDGYGHEEFSTSDCDLCRTHLAGSRHGASIIRVVKP